MQIQASLHSFKHTWWSGVNRHGAADQADVQTVLLIDQAGDSGLVRGEEMLQTYLLGPLAALIHNDARMEQKQDGWIWFNILEVDLTFVKFDLLWWLIGYCLWMHICTCHLPCLNIHGGYQWPSRRELGCSLGCFHRPPEAAQLGCRSCRGSETPHWNIPSL